MIFLFVLSTTVISMSNLMNFILTFKLSWQSLCDISNSSPWQATTSSGPSGGQVDVSVPCSRVTYYSHSQLIINVKSSGGTGIILSSLLVLFTSDFWDVGGNSELFENILFHGTIKGSGWKGPQSPPSFNLQ